MRRPDTLDAYLSRCMTEPLAGDLVFDTAMACMWQDIDGTRPLGEVQAFVDRVCFNEPAGRKIQ